MNYEYICFSLEEAVECRARLLTKQIDAVREIIDKMKAQKDSQTDNVWLNNKNEIK